VFSVVLKYYHEYFDDPTFVNPLRRRHREAAVVGRRRQENAQKDLTVEEFYRFREAILKQKSPDASALAALATVQYFQALRISEVAALHWEDVLLDWRQPKNSRLRVHRHVIYLRRKGDLSFIEEGFKNSTREDSIKEQPLFPESFAALKTLYRLHAKGLVFTNRANTFFDYRKIQSQYDRAFAKSQLPYRGTHVLRHGGTRNLYNETGDLAVAQQLLGNADLESTLVYAKRHKSALTKVADAHWESYSARVGI
jgi:integrase